MTHPYYFHAPGHLSRWGVVDVGLKCMHSCKFCYYSYLDGSDDQFKGMRQAGWQPKEYLIALIDELHKQGFLGFDVTGGEPTLHPDIVEIIRHASGLGMSTRIITLGQYLMRPMKSAPDYPRLMDGLLKAGLTNFLFSYHAHTPELFKQITGEDLGKLQAAMAELDILDFHYTTNTTVFEDNYKHLPEIAESLCKHNTYMHNFIVMNAYYEWGKGGRAGDVQAHYGAIAPYLRQAVKILEDAGIAVNVRYAPHCSVAGLEKNLVGIVGVRYDPYEWMNAIDHKGGGTPGENARPYDVIQGEVPVSSTLVGLTGLAKEVPLGAARMHPHTEAIAKVFPEKCTTCDAIAVCDGVDPRYLAERGADEFIPYRHDVRGNVLDKARLAYRPAFFVKRKQDADMLGLMRRVMRPEAMRRVMRPGALPAQPKVSVVVTCYNYGNYLIDCLDSLVAQTYRNIEVIVVDDCSTDDTAQIADDYSATFDGFRYLKTETNSGQPAYPRNLGIGAADGDLVMCLDADDKIAPSYIEECVRQLQKHPEAAIVYTGTQCFGEGNNQFVAAPYDMAELLKGCRIHCASMYRREVWEAVGGYKTNVRGCEDWNFWIEAGGLGFMGVPLPRQLFFYRGHADGIFESDVRPNYPEKVRQIVLNNSDLYPAEIVRKARNGEDVVKMVQS